MKKILPLTALIPLFVFAQPIGWSWGGGDSPVIISSTQHEYQLAQRVEILSDPSRTLTIDDVTKPPASQSFTRSTSDLLNFGFLSSAHWLRFTLSNRDNRNRDWVLWGPPVPINRVDLYYRSPGGDFTIRRSGDAVPFDQWDISYRSPSFHLTLAPGEMVECYVRTDSPTMIRSRLVLTSWNDFEHKIGTEKVYLGIVLGALAIVVLYNFFFWVALRDRVYGSYLASVVFTALFIAAFQGWTYQYLWPGRPNWNDISIMVFLGLQLFFTGAFTRDFLQTRKHFPCIDQALRGAMCCGLLVCALSPFAPQLSLGVAVLGLATWLAFAVSAALKGAFRWQKTAYYYLAGYSVFFFGFTHGLLVIFNVVSFAELGIATMSIGLPITVFVLSFALVDRFSSLQKEYGLSLEEEVSHRTTELAEANKALQVENVVRKKAEEELSHSQKILSTVLAALPAGIARASSRQIDWANRTFREMFGFEGKEDYVGKSTRIMYSTQEEYLRAGEKLYGELAVKKQARTDATFARKDGTTFAGHIIIAPTDPSNPGNEAIAVITDISERKRTEEALRGSEETSRALLNAAGDAAFLADTDGVVLAANEQYARLSGCTPSEIIGLKFYETWSPDLAASRRTHCDQAVGSGQAVRFVDTREGRWFDNAVYPVKGDRGKVERLAFFSRDITNQKQSEKALRESEERFRQLYQESKEREQLYSSVLGSSADSIIIYDLAGRVRYANASFTTTFGWSLDELVGKRIDFVPEDERDATAQAIRRMLEEGPQKGFETKRCTKDGRILDVSLSGSVYSDHEGKVAGAVVIQRDITDRKRSDRALEAAVAEAEAANRAKSEFLANMSHEIRTPMNAIIGMTDLVMGTELLPKQREYVSIIRSSGRSLLGIINDILDYSKIEAGKLRVEAIAFDLCEVIEEVSDSFRDQVAEKGVELVVDLPNTVPASVIGDPLRLRQVLINLVGNAFKFTEKGDVSLSVRTADRLDSKAILRFSVADTGIGIPADKLDKIFESFSQVDGSTSRRFGGTGLGLTISNNLVRMMGGPGIQVKSHFSQGSEFSFLLPMPVTHWERRLPQELPAAMIGATVLAVDDHPASLKTLAAQLEDLGLTALTAKSAEEAIEALRGGADSRPISLILLDWRLPGMDGLSAARLIREDYRFRSLPIVIMSAYGAEKEMKAKESSAVTSFLPKPLKRSALIRELMEAFGHTCEISSREDVGASVVDLTGVRLLLAEDNKTNQIVACEMLKQAGCTVVVAENGAEAVEAVLHGTFHAVLMDVQMPEMDGLEATRLIRVRPEFRILPVIAMTASAMEGDREKCMAAGMNDYVSKPFDRTELLKVLMRWIPAGLINREAVQESERVDGAVAVSPRLVALPGSLEGINVREALERLGIGPQAYRNLLLGFWRDECSAAENMRRSLEQQDLSTLRRQAHSLAGASGSLSAPALGAAAKELERAAAEAGIKDLPDLLIKVEKELSVVMNSISSLTEEDQGLEPLKATAGVSTSLEFEDLRSLLERLDRAVRDCDPAESRAIADKLAAIPVPNDLGEDLRQIAGLVDQYQFGDAAEILSRARGRLQA